MPNIPKFIPAIRTMQEARDVLAQVLEIQERRIRIITIMMRVVICRTPDTRKFLADSMAGLIEGGLDYMRKKRHDAIEALRRKREAERERHEAEEGQRQAAEREKREAEERRRKDQAEIEAKIRAALEARRAEEEAKRRRPEPAEFEPMEVMTPTAPPPPPPVVEAPPEVTETAVSLMTPEEVKEIEELGTELDALSLAAVAREIFPDLKNEYEPWEVGRAIYMDESSAREAVLQGARLKDSERATMLAPALDHMKRLIENRRPWWAGSLPAIRECIESHFAAQPPVEGGATPQHLFEVIAMADDRAVRMLELIAKSNDPGVAYVADVRQKLEKLMLIEEKRAG